MTDLDLIDTLTARQIVALTLWGEARGEPMLGRAAVASVIWNRVQAQRKGWGLTPRDVCLKPWQFSCWRPSGGEANFGDVLAAAHTLRRGEPIGPVLRECLALADVLLAGELEDVTNGATHYLTRELFRSDRCPIWARNVTPCAEIGAHVFLKGIL